MKSEWFFGVFDLDLGGCELYPRVDFRSRVHTGLLTPGLQTSDSCNARSLAAELTGQLDADALTLALLV
jgi:hypothetical protein